ncbi:DUF5391 family protein [Bacillus mojavensis]|uniref:DUF5391 family protein n=1 Tax=Bacillus mojavensis TaxID=72360 RepID=UPI002DBE9983|nr:DUF5391 family protein [Bacillus mojavensis]MEC1611781.1 DUF5391 family protein [Bacillus mojavensis]MEC1690813.1 DUF5391 family protein [Bacillus mojavensis]MEC1732344.1 DUF5391 family protein [Bacillus mojavensis]MED1006306.1 DUF5391 family protein [Bacillus mojavensis]
MSRKNRVVIMTATSAFLFCAIIAAASLSPLVDTGSSANQFNYIGMWSAIGMILVFYLIPILIYMLGVDAMRFVMAALCGMGLLIHLSTAAIVLMISIFGDHPLSDVITVMVLCLASATVNIIWFFAAFRSVSEKPVTRDFTSFSIFVDE